MMMFYDSRMGVATAGACRAPYWAPEARWFAPLGPNMADVVNLPPGSPQSDGSTDSQRSSPVSDLEGASFDCLWSLCGRRFASLDGLSLHVASTHADVQGGLFYCGWEGCSRGHRGFNARYKMLVHVRTHTNEKPHKCGQCEKSFSRAENLKIHTRSHSGEKPYVCSVEGCNKAYSNSSDRFKHTRTHSVDKPYCCKVAGCQKRYTDPSSLRKHVKTYKHASPSPTLSQDINFPLRNDFDITSPALRLPNNSQYIFNAGSTNIQNGVRENVSKHMTSQKINYAFSESENTENILKIDYNSITPHVYQFNQIIEDQDRLCYSNDVFRHKIASDFEIKFDNNSFHSSASASPLPMLENFHNNLDENIVRAVDETYLQEPLNLKRCLETDEEEIYENGVLNLEKRVKTEDRDADSPLDLSMHKTYL